MSDVNSRPVKSVYGRGGVELVAKVAAEAAEEIVLTDHGQDRYKTRRADPLHRSSKGTLLT